MDVVIPHMFDPANLLTPFGGSGGAYEEKNMSGMALSVLCEKYRFTR